MYEQHFGLKKRPFLAKATGGDVFVGPQTADTMAALKKALAAQDAVVSVSGEAGVGKTTLVTKAVDALSSTHRSIRIGRMQLDGTDALEFLLEELGTGTLPKGPIRQFAAFRELLTQLEARGKRLVILVEDAMRTGIETLAELEALTSSDAGESGGAAMVLMGDENLGQFLADAQLGRLLQRQRQRLAIKPFSVAELRGYLMHCFRSAGGEYDEAFDGKTADVLHSLSGGVPRVANYIAEAALSAAAADGVSPVAAETVARIAQDEFGLEPAPGLLEVAQSAPAPQAKPEPEPPEEADMPSEPAPPATPVAEDLADAQPQPHPIPEPVIDSAPAAELEPDSIPVLEAAPETPDQTDSGSPPNDEDADPIIVFSDATDDEALFSDDDIPELIQDTLPDLEILAPEVIAHENTETELPVLNVSAKPAAEAMQGAQDEAEPEAIPELAAEPIPEPVVEVDAEPAPEPLPEPALQAEAEPIPEPVLEVEAEPEPEPVPEPVLQVEAEPIPDPVPEPAVADEPEQDSLPVLDADPAPPELVVDTLPDHTPELTLDMGDNDVPDWDRDPTLAELRPDLDALERAMAFAHGESEAEDEAEAAGADDDAPDLEDIPEITLDSSIKKGIENALIDEPDGVSPEPSVADEPSTPPVAAPPTAPRKAQRADAEIEKIAAELAKAKTIEDVDDRLAETLFGDEINTIAAQVLAAGPADSANDAAPFDTPKAPVAEASGSAAPAGHNEPMATFDPDAHDAVEISLESSPGAPSGLDLSASQRLRTVRALNAELHPSLREPGNGPDPGPDVPARDIPKPEPIEDQINTSITQTLKTLKITPPVSDDEMDDDGEKRKGGFFSRFKRS